MQLSNINNSKQYFGAQYVTKVQAEKYSNDEESYVPSKLPVVELDLLNKKDVRALKELNLFWQGSDYIMNICYDVIRLFTTKTEYVTTTTGTDSTSSDTSTDSSSSSSGSSTSGSTSNSKTSGSGS